MSLFRKIGILVDALVHRPFAPRREKVDLDEPAPGREQSGSHRRGASAEEDDLPDTERVADLISRPKDAGGERS